MMAKSDFALVRELPKETLVQIMVEWAQEHEHLLWGDVGAMRDLCQDALEEIEADGLGGCLLCQG